MSEKKEYSLAEIAKHTDSIVVGDSMAIVNNLSALETASSDSLSFLSNPKYSKFISASKAQAIIVHDSFDIKDKRNYLVTSDPYLAYAKASSLFKKYVFELDNASIPYWPVLIKLEDLIMLLIILFFTGLLASFLPGKFLVKKLLNS